jgi:hypothetical protein
VSLTAGPAGERVAAPLEGEPNTPLRRRRHPRWSMPAELFETALTLTPPANRYAQLWCAAPKGSPMSGTLITPNACQDEVGHAMLRPFRQVSYLGREMEREVPDSS